MDHLNVLSVLVGGLKYYYPQISPNVYVLRACNIDGYEVATRIAQENVTDGFSGLIFNATNWPIHDGDWYRSKWNDLEINLSDNEFSSETSSNVWANRQPAPLPLISESEMEMMYEAGVEDYNKRFASSGDNEVRGKKRSPSIHHGYHRRSTTPQTKEQSLQAYVKEYVTRAIIEKHDNAPNAVDLQFLGPMSRKCFIQKTPACNSNDRYRTADGTCNNLNVPFWGKSFTTFRRVSPQNYDDGVSKFRKSVTSADLPNPRLISFKTNFADMEKSNKFNCFTLLHMTVGQFLDHDLTFASLKEPEVPCCEASKDPSCAPIAIPDYDPFYSPAGQTCMEFVRSTPAGQCSLGPREQIDELTQYIDLSQVYGSTKEETASLRAYTDGLLKFQDNGDLPDFLPIDNEETACTNEEKEAEGLHCFLAGDFRVNEQILLTVIHTTWMREHNRIARALKSFNPGLNDEKLFQEARRITIAEWQHVVYNEFIPGVLGSYLADEFNLRPLSGYQTTSDYHSFLSAGVSAEFATAAFRFGHSMIPDAINEVSHAGVSRSRVLNSVLEAPFPLYEEGVEEGLVRGFTKQRAMLVDSSFTTQITGQLFQEEEAFGLDLIALNLQRGRDHGLATYLEVINVCKTFKASSFDDLLQVMDHEPLARLKEVYSDFRDIDLFIGGMSERPFADAQVGPTFACLMLDQFIRLKRGDRFWYEFNGSPAPFSGHQLTQLHSVSFARILCDNHPALDAIQRWPLNLISDFNPVSSCNSYVIPSLDLTKFKV
ncbi:hypothetical protein Pmani_017264 [Petrolisthes manimaculis]|uniref:Peroxidase n=1 Tax=Petrolisthes manimaculis TaxID=1843537 RepID=A0AAE1U5Z3_9EUCA|nr:hypothetical protein Pmani_017264 [Petrolisthes manimaculis]